MEMNSINNIVNPQFNQIQTTQQIIHMNYVNNIILPIPNNQMQ